MCAGMGGGTVLLLADCTFDMWRRINSCWYCWFCHNICNRGQCCELKNISSQKMAKTW
jgi:hypothetical protein